MTSNSPSSPSPGSDTSGQPPDEILRLLERNIRDYAIFMLDPDGHVMTWNAAAERIKGYSAEEIIGQHFSTFYLPEDLAVGRPEHNLQTAVREGRVEDEGWRVRRDGSRFWANVVITALYDERRQLRGFGKVTRDMTERRRAEQALRESEERFRLLVQDVTDYAIFMLDATGHVISWNAGAERIKGYSAQEITGRHFAVFYPREDVAAGRPEHNLETAMREGRVEDEGWRLRQDGSRFWANVVITALYDDRRRLRGFGKVTRDMTERREAERNLSDRRRLLAHLVRAQEAERRRIAWDVHDDSIQEMAAVGMRLQLLAEQLSEPQAGQLGELGDRVNDAVNRLRNLVTRLRPPGIDRQSLAAALSDYLAETGADWGVKSTVENKLVTEPPPESAVTIFRICQEALTNVRKHAQAKAVTIRLSPQGSGVLTQVIDDGMGIEEPSDLRPGPDHFGVIEMRERAETVGGWWTMARRAEGGTVVEFWIPAPSGESPIRAGDW
ncbi:MAG TPA: PAS domain S-box protein [Actinocrinis sp.]|nr:PAS domain S-box protein [Actinocrinis sp.]HEV3173026.1 PAS domain S-box protein [Actinocrinis sp.]